MLVSCALASKLVYFIVGDFKTGETVMKDLGDALEIFNDYEEDVCVLSSLKQSFFFASAFLSAFTEEDFIYE